MQSLKTIIICKNYFSVAALKFILKELGVQGNTEIHESFHQILNEKDNCNILFILETDIIPEPKTFSLEKLISKYPASDIIALSSEKIDNSIEAYFAQIINKNSGEKEILNQFRKVLSSYNTEENDSSSEISEREQEIVKFVALGKTNKEISELLNISTHTVITHRKNITAKLGIKTIAGLTIYAVINGIISPEEA